MWIVLTGLSTCQQLVWKVECPLRNCVLLISLWSDTTHMVLPRVGGQRKVLPIGATTGVFPPISNDILIMSLRPSERRPYAIVSVASHKRGRNQKAKVWPAGQTGVGLGGSKIGKAFLAERVAKERGETPWDSRRTRGALAMRHSKKKRGLLGDGQNWEWNLF